MSQDLPEPVKRPSFASRLVAFTGFAQRLLARALLAVYFGGFTFYAGGVVPDLHENLGGIETGEISRRVALFLYAIGAAALAMAWLGLAIDRDQRAGWRGKTRFALLLLSSLFLMALVLMHRSLGAQIDGSGATNGFRSFHEKYLMVWTGQWLTILGLMAVESFPKNREKAE